MYKKGWDGTTDADMYTKVRAELQIIPVEKWSKTLKISERD